MMEKLTVPITRIRQGFDDLPLPAYQTVGSAGVDLRAAVDASLLIEPGGRALVPSGVAIALPTGFEAQVRPRSGLAVKHGVTVLNSPGTIDSDYRGEIRVALINHGSEAFSIERGDRIAQLITAPVIQADWQECQSLNETERNGGGFGHTGK